MNHYCAGEICWLLEQIAVFRRAMRGLKERSGGGAIPEPTELLLFSSFIRSAIMVSSAVQFADAQKRIQRLRIPKPEDSEKPDVSTVMAELKVITDAFHDEMRGRHFLAVAPDRIGFLEPLPDIQPFRNHINTGHQANTFWGNGDNCTIRPAAGDVTAAGNCLAAECNTAAVFHAMRAAEHAIRALAKRLRVSLTHKGKPEPIEYATWEKIIAQIKIRLTAISQLPHGKRRHTQLAHYSDLADHCTYMKDLWRNDVMHTRGDFNRYEAHGILDKVREFIHLVEKKVQG